MKGSSAGTSHCQIISTDKIIYKDNTMLIILLQVKEATPNTYRLIEANETFGRSTAINKCSFSALASIDTVLQISLTERRLRELSFLAFEKKRRSFITEDHILHKICEKNRRIQLL